MKYLLIIGVFLSAGAVNAQNLIENGDFENWYSCNGQNSRKCVANWVTKRGHPHDEVEDEKYGAELVERAGGYAIRTAHHAVTGGNTSEIPACYIKDIIVNVGKKYKLSFIAKTNGSEYTSELIPHGVTIGFDEQTYNNDLNYSPSAIKDIGDRWYSFEIVFSPLGSVIHHLAFTGNVNVDNVVLEQLPDDCAGVSGGVAYLDNCDVCVGGTTGRLSDTDGDGVLDCEDMCPSDANKITPGACGCGVTENSCIEDVGCCERPSEVYTSRSDIIESNTQRYDLIEAKDNVLLEESDDIIFSTGNQIVLKPGFHAQSGSDFKAYVGCSQRVEVSDFSAGPDITVDYCDKGFLIGEYNNPVDLEYSWSSSWDGSTDSEKQMYTSYYIVEPESDVQLDIGSYIDPRDPGIFQSLRIEDNTKVTNAWWLECVPFESSVLSPYSGTDDGVAYFVLNNYMTYEGIGGTILTLTASNECNVVSDELILYKGVDRSTKKGELLLGVDNTGIYPNPTTGLIHLPSQIVTQKVEVYDQTGAQVLEQRGELEFIDLGNLNSGVYSVKIYTETGVETQKIVIHH